VKKGLLGVVEDGRGTAHAVRDPSFQMAGKTGTAQVVRVAQGANRKLLERTDQAKDRDHAWFVGYAPAGNPQICVAVIIEHGGHGSSTAAPLVQKVYQCLFERQGKTGRAIRRMTDVERWMPDVGCRMLGFA